MRTIVWKHAFVWTTIVITAVTLQLACGGITAVPSTEVAGDSDDNTQTATLPLAENGRPIGWVDSTHGNEASPDYGVVFPQGKVLRLDITITSADWQAMLDDMTTKYGQFGRSGPGADRDGDGGAADDPGAPSLDLTAACEGLQEGSACTVASDGETDQGICAASPDGRLTCRLQVDGGEPPTSPEGADSTGTLPPEVLDVCEDLQEGDECSLSFNGMNVTGTCTAAAEGQLVCRPQGVPDPGGEFPGGGQLPGGDAVPGGGGMPQSTDENPIYVPCTLAFEGETWWYVGIRFKGQSSLMSTWSAGVYKLPFRLDFDQFEDDHPEVDNQRFLGF